MKDAWDRNQKNNKHLRGGSTITQQLAKNLFLSGEKSYVRKTQEFVITGMLELVLSKDRIFEIYLNSVEWGEGVFGVASASQHYFAVKPHQLSIEEAASLASALPAPKCYDKVKYCSKARVNFPARIDFILERMNK
jgi:monofunctional biosynthetic peptidoglycan transglycosylase